MISIGTRLKAHYYNLYQESNANTWGYLHFWTCRSMARSPGTGLKNITIGEKF